MADNLTKAQRRFNMSRIRSRDTRPEMVVRSIVHRLGYRFRLHKKDLPGKPDLVLSRHHTIINVHGCFFHMHDCNYGRVVPKTNEAYWKSKRLSNARRDRKNLTKLKQDGWRVILVWECETKEPSLLVRRIARLLGA